jgi:hypothetical protein
MFSSNSGGQVPNQFIVGEVEAEVQRRMAAGDSFTAFDISRAVQATGIQERHRHMKGIVHDMYERGDMPGYIRTQITLPTGEQPFLYHPDNRMIPNRFAVATNTGTKTLANHTASLFGQGRTALMQTVGHLDSDYRLRLPSSILRKAGFYPGDTVYIARDADTGTLTIRATPANAPDIRPTRSHRLQSCNLRLTLGNVFAAVALRFLVTVAAPGKIEIKPGP